MYELIAGIPPFNDSSVAQIFENIENNIIEWPLGKELEEEDPDENWYVSHEALDLMKKLLNPDYKKRLGANGA